MVGVSCVAVPIKDQKGKVYAGLSFSVPTVRMDKKTASINRFLNFYS